MPEQTDDMMDQLLHEAGARLRASAPESAPGLTDATVVPIERGRQRSRVLIGAIIGVGVAAAVVLVVVLTGQSNKSLQPSPVVTQPEISVAPTVAPSTVASSTVVSEPTTPEEVGPTIAGAPQVSVTNANWDGAGGACVTLAASDSPGGDDVTGCLRGADAAGPNGPTTLIVSIHGQTYALTGSSGAGWTSFEVATDDADPCGSSAIDTAAMLLVVRCEDESKLVVELPSTVDGTRQAFALPPTSTQWQFDHPLALTELTSPLTPSIVGVRAFLGSPVITPGSQSTLNCVVVVGDTPGWRESCAFDQEGPSRFLFVHRDGLLLGEVTSTGALQLTRLTDGAALRIAGCDAPAIDLVRAVESTSGLVSALGCGGDSTMVGTSPVALTAGSLDGSTHLMHREASGTWTDLGGGTSYPCQSDLSDVCAQLGIEQDGDAISASPALPPIEWFTTDDLALLPEVITEQVRALLPADGTTLDGVSDAVATWQNPGGEPAPTFVDVPGSSLRVMQFRLPDDSTTNATIALWTRKLDGKINIERAIRIYGCGRAVTTVDGQPACV